MNTLNPFQHQAAYSDDPNIVVIAGPGSGKTHTLVARIAALIANGCPADEIVAITFTNAAAREFEHRIAATIGRPVKLGYAGTLHGFMLRLIQRNAPIINYQSEISIIDQEQAQEILATIIANHCYRGSEASALEAVERGPHAGADGTTADLLRMDYYQTLRSMNVLDFDSILFYGLSIVRKINPNCWDYKHLFVDEYQDSCPVDDQIYDALPIPNRFFVGDVDQSIYGFRGSDPGLMLFRIGGPGLKVGLNYNYRCGAEICKAADMLIGHNTARFPKVNKPIPENGSGKIVYGIHANPVNEMNWIVGQISRLEKPEDVAVLCRSNAQASEIASFLESFGVPVARKVKLTLPPDWRACRALLAAAASPDNDALAYNAVKMVVSKAKADEVKLKALRNFRTINELVFMFKPGLALSMVPAMLAEARISEESIKLVWQSAEQLKDLNATVADLLCAMSIDEQGTTQIGKGVTVTTIHAAKGREFETVFLPGMEQGMLPLTSKDVDIEEERRLAFVAITRAKQNLFISRCKMRKRQWVEDAEAKPSQFIAEMGVANNA